MSNNGQKCLTWSEAAETEALQANFGNDTPGASPDQLDGNFCRAFVAGEKPWCYVQGFVDAASAKQECDVPACPTDGPWAKDYKQEAADADVQCTAITGEVLKECKCDCSAAGKKALVQVSKSGEKYMCHC